MKDETIGISRDWADTRRCGGGTDGDQEASLVDIARGPEFPEEAPEDDGGRNSPVGVAVDARQRLVSDEREAELSVNCDPQRATDTAQ